MSLEWIPWVANVVAGTVSRPSGESLHHFKLHDYQRYRGEFGPSIRRRSHGIGRVGITSPGRGSSVPAMLGGMIVTNLRR